MTGLQNGFSRRQFVQAGLAVAFVGVLISTGAVGAFASGRIGKIRTGVGERRSVDLADGSVVDLDARTTITVDYDVGIRRVALLEGRARFVVAEQSHRPFEILCDGSATRTAGASVVVHKRTEDAVVAVEEGTVTVEGLPVAAGRELAYRLGGKQVSVSAAGAGQSAWRDGKLVFEGQRLQDVVDDINRYRAGTIFIRGKALASLRVDAIIDVTSAGMGLSEITRALPVTALPISSDVILLAPRSA
jgi:transmembrane sensor